MDIKFRRPITSYIFFGLWIPWSIYRFFNSPTTVAQVTWIVIALMATIGLANILIRKNYFEISGNKLTIYKDYFRTRTIELDEIEKIDLHTVLFTFSKIILKNKTQVKFNDNYLDTDELKKLMGQLNIPVE